MYLLYWSDTFQKVHHESEFHWLQLQNDFFEEYSIKTPFPIHLQLLVLPFTIVHAMIWFFCPYLCGKFLKKYSTDDGVRYSLNDEYEQDEDEATLNRSPMFVRGKQRYLYQYQSAFLLKLDYNVCDKQILRSGIYRNNKTDILGHVQLSCMIGNNIPFELRMRFSSDFRRAGRKTCVYWEGCLLCLDIRLSFNMWLSSLVITYMHVCTSV